MIGLFSAWRDWRERAGILHDMRRRAGDAAERDKFVVRDALTYALSALGRNDRKQAEELWTKSFRDYPRETRASPLAFKVLLGLGRFDEAEELMREGQKRHPRSVFYVIGLGQVLQMKGEYEAGIEQWAALRKQFPGAMEGYTLGADALLAAKRLDEAEALSKQAMIKFPEELTGFLGYARVAVARKDWEEALQRCEPLRDRFGYSFGYIGGAEALVELGRFDEADTLLKDGRVRFPTDVGVAVAYAQVAERRGDVTESVARWKRVAERFPLAMHSCLLAADALEKLGSIDDAAALLQETAVRSPDEMRPLQHLGMFLHRQRNFAEAVEVWSKLRSRFPEDETGYVRGIEALRGAGRAEDARSLEEERSRKFLVH